MNNFFPYFFFVRDIFKNFLQNKILFNYIMKFIKKLFFTEIYIKKCVSYKLFSIFTLLDI